MSEPKITATLYELGLNQPVQEFDLTGYSPRNIERFWDGLVLKVDFARYYMSPGLDELLAAAEVSS